MNEKLTTGQKWQLTLYLTGLFFPLLTYANLPDDARNLATLLRISPFLVLFFGVNAGLYYLGITATDWCQRLVTRWLGEDVLTGRGGQSFLITFSIALLLAILFINAFHGMLALLVLAGQQIAPERVHIPVPSEIQTYIERANNAMSVVTMLSAFYLTMNLRMLQQVKDVQLRAERLENQALKGQFEALKNQLSPHFLFNSLSILTSLIHEDAALSERFVRQLSKTYRYILDQRNQDLVLLKTELDFIRSYTFLLQIRFEQKFEVLVDVPERLQVQYQIAPLTLQLLVENAVKHNRMSLHERLQIRIYTQADQLLIANVLQPRDQPESSTGVGLQNIVNRYSILTKRPVTYGQAGGEFIVSLPLLVNNGALQNAPDTTVSQLES
jgi:hypothetical protein